MNNEPTTITITDPVLLKQLAEATGPIMFRDTDGNVIRATGGLIGVPPPGAKPPFSDEELELFGKNRDGRPLADILRDLREKHGA